MHAAEIPRERGRRGRLRDLLTIFDEGGAIVQCDDAEVISLLKGFEWKKLFWENRERVLDAMRIVVLGHAVLEKALEPWPGVACKAILVAASARPDAAARDWLAGLPADASPRLMPQLPIFGCTSSGRRTATCRSSASPAGTPKMAAPPSTTTRATSVPFH